MDNDSKKALYKISIQSFMQAQQFMNTVAFMGVKFSVYGEDVAGRQVGSGTLDVKSLLNSINVLG